MNAPNLFLGALVLIAISYVAFKRNGTAINPPSIFSAFWALFLLFPFAHSIVPSVVPGYPNSAGGIWWIVLSIATFTIGFQLVIERFAEIRPRWITLFPQTSSEQTHLVALVALSGSVLLGLTYVVYSIITDIEFALGGPFPLWLQLLLPFYYAAPLLGGIFARLRLIPSRWTLTTALTLAAPLLLSFSTGGRMALILPVLSWLAAYLAADLLATKGKSSLFTPTRIMAMGAVAVAIILLGASIYIIRIQTPEPGSNTLDRFQSALSGPLAEDVNYAWRKQRFAMFGQPSTFAHYFDEVITNGADPKWGATLFAGPLNQLGITARSGFDSYFIEDINPDIPYDNGVITNTFTIFRLPINDFGLIGSLIFWLLIGAIQGLAFNWIKAGSILGVPLFAWFALEVFTIGGYMGRYNSVIVSWLIVFIVIALLARTAMCEKTNSAAAESST